LRLHRPTVFRALTYWAHRTVVLAIAGFLVLYYLSIYRGVVSADTAVSVTVRFPSQH